MTARLAYRVREAGEQLGLSERQTWRLIRAGDLRVVRAGRATLVPHASLERFLARGLNNEAAADSFPGHRGDGLELPAIEAASPAQDTAGAGDRRRG
jgi:excisionase family DNA binding protein